MCGAHLRATRSTRFISVYSFHSGWNFRGNFIAALPSSSTCMTSVLTHSPEHHQWSGHGELLGFLILKLIIWLSFLCCLFLQWISLPILQCPWMLATYQQPDHRPECSGECEMLRWAMENLRIGNKPEELANCRFRC